MIEFEEKKELVIPLGLKYIKIYDRTKNRRIKKKQMKKAPIIKLREAIEQEIGNVRKKDIHIYINGKEIENRR